MLKTNSGHTHKHTPQRHTHTYKRTHKYTNTSPAQTLSILSWGGVCVWMKH